VNQFSKIITSLGVHAFISHPWQVPYSLLSFEDDLESEGPEFQVRKSNHSRRVAKMLEREKRKEDRSRWVNSSQRSAVTINYIVNGNRARVANVGCS